MVVFLTDLKKEVALNSNLFICEYVMRFASLVNRLRYIFFTGKGTSVVASFKFEENIGIFYSYLTPLEVDL